MIWSLLKAADWTFSNPNTLHGMRHWHLTRVFDLPQIGRRHRLAD
jgi:hypothetical protein